MLIIIGNFQWNLGDLKYPVSQSAECAKEKLYLPNKKINTNLEIIKTYIFQKNGYDYQLNRNLLVITSQKWPHTASYHL